MKDFQFTTTTQWLHDNTTWFDANNLDPHQYRCDVLVLIESDIVRFIRVEGNQRFEDLCEPFSTDQRDFAEVLAAWDAE